MVGSGSGGGSAGVGASNDTTVLVKTVKATLRTLRLDNSLTEPRCMLPEYHHCGRTRKTVISITAGFAGGGSAGVGGGVFVSTNDIQAYIGKEAIVITDGSVAIESRTIWFW